MKFLDEARIEVKAGHGGAGMCHFRREKFVPMGGPDGGDGGNGGSVILRADRRKQTLLDLHKRPIWRAKDGQAGGTNNRQGKSATDLIISVPIGTQAFSSVDQVLLCDLLEDGARYVLAEGGRGGKGNAHFKSSTNQAPQHAQAGEEGGAGIFFLLLKLIADVGLIGLPNAGKSTLISRISSARPKIADYPFTTLVPNLGVVKCGDSSFVVADIPGLIPGAHQGKGLGIKFLKHVERSRILVHLLDCNQVLEDMQSGDVLRSYTLIHKELLLYAPELAERERFVLFTKIDTIHERDKVKEAMRLFRQQGLDTFLASAITGEGVSEFVQALGKGLANTAES